MSDSAWAMLIGTWTVIIGFTSYFFGRILRHKGSPSAADPDDEEPSGDDAPPR
jgi:hypothetical protein